MPRPYQADTIGRNLVNKRSKVANANGLPGMITCRLCKTPKSTTADFSKTQLRPYQPSVHNPNPNYDNIKATCKACTGKQMEMMECLRCDKKKPLDKFSKRQRKNPELATCELCMQMIGDSEPGVPMPDPEDYMEAGGGEESDSEEDFDGVPNGAIKKSGGQGGVRLEEEKKKVDEVEDEWAHFYRSKK